MNQYGIAIEGWDWKRRFEVKKWLRNTFGEEGERWGTEYDYGLDNLWMNEDVYTAYLLRWS